ncbi:hypothetical protein V3C99_014955 [Haemonchus contortus]
MMAPAEDLEECEENSLTVSDHCKFCTPFIANGARAAETGVNQEEKCSESTVSDHRGASQICRFFGESQMRHADSACCSHTFNCLGGLLE